MNYDFKGISQMCGLPSPGKLDGKKITEEEQNAMFMQSLKDYTVKWAELQTACDIFDNELPGWLLSPMRERVIERIEELKNERVG